MNTELLFPIFNLALGIIFILIGSKVYRPFDKEKEENILRKFGLFFKFGGAGLTIWGILNLLLN